MLIEPRFVMKNPQDPKMPANPEDNIMQDEQDEIDLAQLDNLQLTQEESNMLEQVSSELGFKVALENLLASLDGMEPAELQSRVLLLLGQFFRGRIKDPKMLKGLRDDEMLKKNIKNLSMYLLQTQQAFRQANRGIASSNDKYEYLTRRARDNVRKIIQRFAVYELYKFITPKRIAGETKKDNFVHNMVVGGIQRASHFEGGSDLEVKSYGKTFVEKLEKAHAKFVKGSGKGMML